MSRRSLLCPQAVVGILALLSVTASPGQTTPERPATDTRQAARLEFMRDAVQDIEIASVASDDQRDLKFKPQPILRYNDPARGVADSAVWRLGTKGRPIALVTSEVYGPEENGSFRLSHEFLAIDKPNLTLRSGDFKWVPPPLTALEFRKFQTAEKPLDKPTLRLNQMKRLAQRFAMRQEYQGEKIELRLLTTPIDRYTPSEKARADGAIFAAVWGVNPEVLLFIESNGDGWSYALFRSSSANLWATLDGSEVWSQPRVDPGPTMAYSLTVSAIKVPVTTFSSGPRNRAP